MLKSAIKKCLIAHCLLFVLAASLWAHSVSAQENRQRVALVIGNANYKNVDALKTPINDASGMSAKLRVLGFDVISIIDATQRQMQESLIAFSEKLETANVGLLYYSGHSLQIDGKNYLIPIDGRIMSKADLRLRAMNLELYIDAMTASTKTSVILLDASRENPMADVINKVHSASGTATQEMIAHRGLAKMDLDVFGSQNKQIIIGYSANPGQVSLDGSGSNSPYTAALLRHIDAPEIDIEDMMKIVSLELVRSTHGVQQPWNWHNLLGEFEINPKKNIAASKHATEQVSGPSPTLAPRSQNRSLQEELSHWNIVKDTNDVAMLQNYINRFPHSSFLPLAKIKLRYLHERKAKSVAELSEQTSGLMPGTESPSKKIIIKKASRRPTKANRPVTRRSKTARPRRTTIKKTVRRHSPRPSTPPGCGLCIMDPANNTLASRVCGAAYKRARLRGWCGGNAARAPVTKVPKQEESHVAEVVEVDLPTEPKSKLKAKQLELDLEKQNLEIKSRLETPTPKTSRARRKTENQSQASSPVSVPPENTDDRMVGMLAASVNRKGQTDYHSLAVRIPENHKTGSIEDPNSWHHWLVNFDKSAKNKETFFQFSEPRKLTEKQFINLVRVRNRKTGLVFVHGYNNSFRDAAFRAAQISWDTRFDRMGELFLFKWHSSASTLAYKYDRDSITIAREPFVKFLKLLQEQTHLEQIHVLAHSMGNRLVLDAMATHSHTLLKQPIGELIMAHPDIDRDVYRTLVKQAKKYTKGMTLYASKQDWPLWISKQTGSSDVAGSDIKPDPDLLGLVDVIDISALADSLFSLQHNTFATNRTLLEDIVELIAERTRPPHKRTKQLLRIPESAEFPDYWRFPK